MNIRYVFIIILSLSLVVTSCSIDEELLPDNSQIDAQSGDTSDPPSEGTGEEDELEPNN